MSLAAPCPLPPRTAALPDPATAATSAKATSAPASNTPSPCAPLRPNAPPDGRQPTYRRRQGRVYVADRPPEGCGLTVPAPPKTPCAPPVPEKRGQPSGPGANRRGGRSKRG